MILTFNANNEKCHMLSQNDETMRKLIKLVGEVTLAVEATNPFKSLVMSIIGQQLSSKAAATIRGRAAALVPAFTPEAVYALDADELRNVGLSRPKVSYMKDLCEKIIDKQLDFQVLETLEDAEVIASLTQVKGIGKWTAEMFLIFSLGRMDVLSLGDAGLQRAAKWLYQMDERSDKNYLGVHADKWKPLRSVASLYLWEAVDRGMVNSGKSVEELYNEQKKTM